MKYIIIDLCLEQQAVSTVLHFVGVVMWILLVGRNAIDVEKVNTMFMSFR